MARKVKLPTGVWFQKKRLASGEVVRYGYLGRGPGTEPLGLEGSADFHARLAEAMQRAPQEGRVAFLVHRFLNSAEFAAKRPLTQRDYRRHLGRIQEKFGGLSIRAMASPQICDHLYRWRDDLAEASPRQADYSVSVLSALLSWSVRRGLIDHNRAAGIPDVYAGDRSESVWSLKQEAALLAVASQPIRRAVIFALETGLSQKDLIALPWAALDGAIIQTKRSKTGKAVAIPVSPTLARLLADMPRGLPLGPVLTRADGLPWAASGNGLRSEFRAAAKAAGVAGLTFNDLRGTFISRRREMGWTAEETALCSGHPIEGEKGAQSAYVNRAAVALANAKRLLERTWGSESEQILQTALQTAGGAREVSL